MVSFDRLIRFLQRHSAGVMTATEAAEVGRFGWTSSVGGGVALNVEAQARLIRALRIS